MWIRAFIGALAAILAIGFVSYTEISALANSSARVQRSYDMLQTLTDLQGALANTETSQRGFLLTQNGSYLTQYDAAIAQIRLALTELHRLSANEPATAGSVARLAQLAGAKLDEMQTTIHASEAGKRRATVAKLVDGEGKRLMDAFRRDSAELESVQRRVLEQRRQEEYEARLASEAVLVAAVVLSLLFVGVAAIVSRRFDERRRMLENEMAERRRAENYREALLVSERAARSEAERATHLKDEFVATLSHELRTPLNAIVGWASILRRDQRAESVAQGVEVIERNAKLQAQMVEDLLDMSRILSGKLRVELQKTDLPLVIDAAIASVRTTADAKGVHLRTGIRSKGAVNGDPGRLQQVVWNLLTNAIKFTPRNGVVEVSLRNVNGQLEIAVSDTGQGIKADFLPFVFDRFRQADASTTRRHGGLGLGLSIVKSLVEMHGGAVDVRSPGEGQGTTFLVRLPLALTQPHGAEEPAGGRPRKADESPPLTGLRILVVDDEPDARTLARRVLEERGADVVTAGSTAEALAAVEGNHTLSLIISDIGMPEQDGYDFIRQMRALPGEAGRVPAVALTALARSEDRRRALLAGYQTHVSKPVDPAELVAVIASLAGRTGRASNDGATG
jgi:signal transduction histidine kinase/ActR/RegA family two-component response regulator